MHHSTALFIIGFRFTLYRQLFYSTYLSRGTFSLAICQLYSPHKWPSRTIFSMVSASIPRLSLYGPASSSGDELGNGARDLDSLGSSLVLVDWLSFKGGGRKELNGEIENTA